MKTALRIAMLAAPLLAGSLPTVKPEEVGMSTERLQRIDQMIQRRIAAGELAGAVAIVARNGKVAHFSAQGVMDLESKQAMNAATMFRIASMTKPVTGVAVMMMVEEGKLRLNDPVSRYIPEFRGIKVAVAQPGGAGRGGQGKAAPAAPQFYTMPAQREITIKDLLTHVSGLGSGPMGDSEIAKVARRDNDKLADYIPRLGTTPLEFQPGSRWTYSPGAGFETLGRLVEIASGMPLDQFFRTRIFEPLGMKDIAFWPTDAQWPRVATVYGRGANGLTRPLPPTIPSARTSTSADPADCTARPKTIFLWARCFPTWAS
jgi:CubicO group peptidase (beta-lactamase class C family)